MSAPFHRTHPQEIYTPPWHYEAQTPIIDRKYHDPQTGALLTASNHEEFSGPPAVDMVITNLHADTTHCVYRAQRPFPVEVLLAQVVKVIQEKEVSVDSLVVTKYAVRVVLSWEVDVKGFYEVAFGMANGVWEEKKETG